MTKFEFEFVKSVRGIPLSFGDVTQFEWISERVFGLILKILRPGKIVMTIVFGILGAASVTNNVNPFSYIGFTLTS